MLLNSGRVNIYHIIQSASTHSIAIHSQQICLFDYFLNIIFICCEHPQNSDNRVSFLQSIVQRQQAGMGQTVERENTLIYKAFKCCFALYLCTE